MRLLRLGLLVLATVVLAILLAAGFVALGPGVTVVIAGWTIGGAIVGGAIGRGKGHVTTGFWLGFFLGVIGWIVVAVMEPTPEIEAKRAANFGAAIRSALPLSPDDAMDTRSCPWCAETIKAAAIVCRYCGRDIATKNSGSL
jgi:hypothetical protein